MPKNIWSHIWMLPKNVSDLKCLDESKKLPYPNPIVSFWTFLNLKLILHSLTVHNVHCCFSTFFDSFRGCTYVGFSSGIWSLTITISNFFLQHRCQVEGFLTQIGPDFVGFSSGICRLTMKASMASFSVPISFYIINAMEWKLFWPKLDQISLGFHQGYAV